MDLELKRKYAKKSHKNVYRSMQNGVFAHKAKVEWNKWTNTVIKWTNTVVKWTNTVVKWTSTVVKWTNTVVKCL